MSIEEDLRKSLKSCYDDLIDSENKQEKEPFGFKPRLKVIHENFQDLEDRICAVFGMGDWGVIGDFEPYHYKLGDSGMDQMLKTQIKRLAIEIDVNLEKENTITDNNDTVDNPKNMLKFFQTEFENAIKNQSLDGIIQHADRLKEYLNKIQLYQADRIHLNARINYLRKTAYDTMIALDDINDENWVKNHFEEWLGSDFKILKNQLDTIIKNPQEIKMRLIQTPKKKKSWFSNVFSSKQKDSQMLEESLEIPKDNFQGIFNVFISHKFVKSDQKLALELRKELRENQIEGYLAESTREYELLIGDKIREAIDKSKFVVAILTKNSQTSASVNQELGYALGIKKPILFMVEKGVEHGVLTQGRDPEEFSRASFSNHCKPIVEYILDKVKPNSKTPSNILREKVYPELYDEMMTIHENPDRFKAILVNPWKDISPSVKLKIEDDIKQLFEKFTAKLSDWNTTFSRVDHNFTINKAKLGEIISPAFAQVNLIKPDGYIMLDSRSSQQPDAWIDAFKFILFDETIVNDQILYEKLVKYAQDTENGHLRWLQDWKTQKPTLFGHIFDTLPQLRKVLRIEFYNEEMQKEKENINILLEKIIKILEKRI